MKIRNPNSKFGMMCQLLEKAGVRTDDDYFRIKMLADRVARRYTIQEINELIKIWNTGTKDLKWLEEQCLYTKKRKEMKNIPCWC